MKNVYIITEEGSTWDRSGLDWIEDVMKPKVGETDATYAYMGMVYNSPGLMVAELEKHPDSYVILSYEHVTVFLPSDTEELCRMIEWYHSWNEDMTVWQILMDHISQRRNPS